MALASCEPGAPKARLTADAAAREAAGAGIHHTESGIDLVIGTQYTTDNDESRFVRSGRLLAQKSNAGKSRKARKTSVKKSSSLLPGQYPESSERLLTEKDVEHQTPWGMKVMENEIYARHGYIFRDADLKKHFKTEKWYRGRQRAFNKIKLSPIEVQNVSFIKRYQQKAKV